MLLVPAAPDGLGEMEVVVYRVVVPGGSVDVVGVALQFAKVDVGYPLKDCGLVVVEDVGGPVVVVDVFHSEPWNAWKSSEVTLGAVLSSGVRTRIGMFQW